MKRRLIPIAAAAAALLLSVAIGHRAGDAIGEARATQRNAAGGGDKATGRAATAAGNSAGSRTAAHDVAAWLERMKSRLFQTTASKGSVSVGMGDSAIADEMNDLTLGEVQAALDLVKDWPPGRQRHGMIMALLARWAREDAPAALAYANANRESASPYAAFWFAGVFLSWADKEPQVAADAMVRQFRDESDDIVQGASGNTVFMVMDKLARRDFRAAMKTAADLPEWAQRSAMAAVSRQVNGEGREAFLEAIRQLPDATARETWRQDAALALVRTEPAAASAFLDSFGLPPKELDNATRWVFHAWRLQDAPAAVAWASERLPATERPLLLQNAVTDWAEREPNDCGRWLATLPDGPELDGAFTSFAQAISAKDPESARAWAGRIHDPAHRAAVLAELAKGGQKE